MTLQYEERLSYERRILAAECGSQRILNELLEWLDGMARHARFTPDVLDPKGAEILENVAVHVRNIDVCATPAIETLLASLAAKDAEIAALRAALTWYADQFCEFGTSNEGCGKFDDDVCAGCKARSALHQNPESKA